MRLRKHPLILIGSFIPYAILDYLPYLLPKLGEFLATNNPSSTVDFALTLSFANPWVSFIVGIYWLFVWMAAFSMFTNHFLDEWVITNERVIDVNQRNFWNRQVDSLFLYRVQNVETEVDGVFGTLFGFGTVSVESAGAELNRIRMQGLSHPDHVRDVLLREVARHEERRMSGTPVSRV